MSHNRPRTLSWLIHQWLVYHEDQIDEIAMWAIIVATAISVGIALWLGGH